MSFTLILNSTNVVGPYNNTFRYNFITGGFRAKDAQIAISNITLPYSWFNISAAYGNNKLSISFPTGSSTYLLNITFPDGYYTVNDLQNYIELQCQNNGLYLINTSGNYVYYTQFSYNPTYYAVQLICFVVPTTADMTALGYTRPPASGSNIYSTLGTGLPTTAQTPRVYFAATGSIAPIVGFNVNTYYPSAASVVSYNINSPNTPNGTIVNSLICQCNIVSNSCTSPSNILDSIPIDSVYGSNINYSPSFEKWVKVKDGTYSDLTITFSDQNLNTLYAKDPNVSIVLLIKENVKF